MYRIYKINELGEQTIKKLYSQKSEIDFFPYYQRVGNIWSIEKKQLLIDTIINKYDIPKFYFNYFISPDDELNLMTNFKYAVIDGKQRLQAIFDFLDNKFKLSSSCSYQADPSVPIRNLTFRDLKEKHPSIAFGIEAYVLDIVFIATDEEDKLEELFLRLNGGIALTNAEKRNAIGGYLNVRIREIVDQNLFFTEWLRFKNVRYQYNDLLTKLLYIESKNGLANLGNKELQLFLKSNQKKTIIIEDVLSNTLDNLSVMADVFEQKDLLLRSKGIIPVYYQFIKDKARSIENLKLLREFFIQFDDLKIQNRKDQKPDPVLQEFDRLNQQGVHVIKSLNDRYKILDRYFAYFLKNGKLKKLGKISEIESIEDDFLDEY